jgi:hypothetical protein
MEQQDIVEKVREIMNEAGDENTFSLLSEDHIRLNDYIESVIPDAVNILGKEAPLRLLNATEGRVTVDAGKDCSTIALPSDFLRAAAVKLKEWKRAVFLVYPQESEEYNIQHNEYTTAGVNKPKCVFGATGIECFPSGRLEYFRYIKRVSKYSMSFKTLKKELFEALCYLCASLVYDIFENRATSDKMRAISQEFMK